jgi:hypothetical protein
MSQKPEEPPERNPGISFWIPTSDFLYRNNHLKKEPLHMKKGLFLKAGLAACLITGAVGIACNSDSPSAPKPQPTSNFHITYPKNGAAFNMGSPLTVRWSLPDDGSIDSVIVYRKISAMNFAYDPLNQYMPVVAPVDTYDLYIGSDAPGQDFKLGIRKKSDSTKFDEITIHENGY